MTGVGTTTRRVPSAAVGVTVVGLLLMLAAMPFAPVRLHGWLRESGERFRAAPARFTSEDALFGVFVAAVVVVIVLAVVLRRPMVMAWAALPVALVVGWMLLVVSDVQFDSSYVASDVQTRMNRDRSMAAAGWLNLVGMLVALAGLAFPAVERRLGRR